MKEQGPINPNGLTPTQSELTAQANAPKLEVRRDIFMLGEPGGEVPQSPRDINPDTVPQKKPDVRGAVIREGLRRTVFRKNPGAEVSQEDQDKSRRAWDEFYKDKKMLPGEQQVVEAIIKEGGMPDGIRGEPVPADSGSGGGQEPPTPPTSPPGGENGNQDQGETGNVRAEEAGRVGVKISTEGVSNPQILSELEAVNSLIGERGDVDYEFLKSTQHRLARLSGEHISGDEKNKAISRLAILIADKEAEMRHLSREERSRELAREITGQTGYNLEEILTDSKKRDEVFNDLFAGVDATPHEFFERAFNPLTYGMRFERFMDIIRNGSINKIKAGERALTEEEQEALKKDFDRYQTERRVRQSLHDANAILYLPSIKAEQLYDSMQQFSSDLGTFAWKMTGVKQMMDIYEAALREDMMKNNGYLNPEAVIGTVTRSGVEPGKEAVVSVKRGTVEEKTKDRFRQMMKARLIARKNAQGQDETVPGFKDWEIDRIFTISRGMMIMSERLLSLAAESRLPKGMAQFSSLFLQDVIQSYAPYIHLLGKYGVTAESLAAYLYKEGEGQRLLGDIRRWNPHELREVIKNFTGKEPEVVQEILYSDEAMRYLMRPNPNRAGDIFTWVSWRVVEDPETVSMIQDFLQIGRKKMWWRENHPGEDLPSDKDVALLQIPNHFKNNEYANWIGTAIRLEKLRGKLAGLTSVGAMDPDEWRRKNPDAEMPSEMAARQIIEQMVKLQPHRLYLVSPDIRGRIPAFQKSLLEFGNRLIPLGKTLADLDLSSKDVNSYLDEMFTQKDEKGKVKKNKRGESIIDRQKKDRLRSFLEELKREAGELPKFESDNNVQAVLNDLSLVETAILGDREQLLSQTQRKTFNDLDLNNPDFDRYFAQTLVDIMDADGNLVVSATDRIARAKSFARILRGEYEVNKEKYYDEFIYKREYKHGFVLWTGDAPIDEYNANAVGPTAGFARRARDNKNQAEAFTEEIKMLVSLREIKTPDEAIKALTAVFDKIAIYDGGKAKQAIAEKAKGLAYFFGADTLTNVPILGQILEQSGKASVAQMVYGKTSGVWRAAAKRYFFTELKDRGMLTKTDYDKIAKEGFATRLDVAMDIGSALSQLLVLAFVLYMMQKVAKEK